MPQHFEGQGDFIDTIVFVGLVGESRVLESRVLSQGVGGSGSQGVEMMGEGKKIRRFEDIVGWPRLNKRYKGLTG